MSTGNHSADRVPVCREARKASVCEGGPDSSALPPEQKRRLAQQHGEVKPDRSSAGLVAGMGGCYALGTFTDNFYKQAAVLLAAGSLTWVQSVATILYALPFILFSAWAGWLADRLVKKHIVVAAKVTELAALLLGAFALVTLNWWGILAVIFLMGLQATIFSPALNGSIPESFPAHQVPRINSLIKLASTAAILVGIAASGIFLDLRPGGLLPAFGLQDGELFGRYASSIFIIIIAAAGVLTAFTLRRRPAVWQKGDPVKPFPWLGPVDSVRHLWQCRKDEQLFLVLLAEAYFYGVAAMAVVSIANLAKDLGYSATTASLLSAILMIGVAMGSILAGRYPADSWKRLLFPSAGGMGAFLALISLAPLFSGDPFFAVQAAGLSLLTPQLCWLGITLFLAGVCGGIYLIPLASFIQVRPSADEKGKVLGVSNFLSFVSIALWGAVFGVVRLLPPAGTFVFYGLVTMCFAPLVVGRRLGRMQDTSLKDASGGLLGLFLRMLLSLRYKVHESGLESIPAMRPPEWNAGETQHPEEAAAATAGKTAKPGTAPKQPGILFLPNHPALIDPVIVYSRLAGLKPRPLVDEGQMKGRLQRFAGRVIRAIIVPDLRKAGRAGVGETRKALGRVIEALQSGDNVLLYPSGRIYRSELEEIGANSAVAQILAAVPDCRVVLVRTKGLWGSSFSYASGRIPQFMRRLSQGALSVLGNLMVLTPRREVDMEFIEPEDLPRNQDFSRTESKMRLNAWLENFYNEAREAAVAVPRQFWQGREPGFMPVEENGATSKDVTPIPETTRESVYRILRETAELGEDFVLAPEQTLAADLGLDSLSLMDLASALEAEYGYPVNSLERLNTVADCLLAATGRLESPEEAAKAIPEAWFAMDSAPAGDALIYQPENAPTLVHCFLHHVHKGAARPLLADRRGIHSRKAVLTAALALSARFKVLPGSRLGIMLPASPAAMIAWLATLLAGKEPVMLNWTVGKTNMLHCLRIAGINHAVTASALLEQLERQGNSLADIPLEWLPLEELAASLSWREKVRAAVRSTLCGLGLPAVSLARVPETAAILFTSGSEAAPKAVPLSHKNIMSNAGDLAAMLGVRQKDRVLSMLPPFHSFGLLVGNALPAATGTCVACHPNPTESAPLVHLVKDFKLTLLGATPTFLEGMLQRAKDTDFLASLRFGFVGAEKCPDRVYRAFSECCPDASLCEGYGITECSPVIAVNPPENVKPGSIGMALPSVHTAIVKEEDASGSAQKDAAVNAAATMSRVRAGESGVLLVRGPSIFSGYLGDVPSPFVEFEGKQWYRTGDLVTEDETGRLTFIGRLKRFVKIGGEMISLPQMESLLQSAFAGRADLPEDGNPYLAVEVRPGSEDAGKPEILAFTVPALSLQEVNQALRTSGLSALYSVHRVVHLPRIPLLGTGKTDYQALKRLV